jgi:hypothetical protein
MFKRLLLGSGEALHRPELPLDYCPPSLCHSDNGAADIMGGGGLDALVDNIVDKLDDKPKGDGAAEDEEQDQAPAEAGDADVAPEEDQPSDEEDDEKPEPDAGPPIEPPPFWDKEQAEHWQKLPRATQEYIRSREGQRDGEVRRLQSAFAEVRQAFEPEVQATRQERQRYVEQATTYISLAEQFDPVLTAGQNLDWTKAAAEDPAGTQQLWFAYQQRRAHFDAAVKQRDAIDAQITHEKLAQEGIKLVQSMPEWHGKDQAETLQKAKEGLDIVRAFAVKQYGFKPADVAVIRDARVAKAFEDARKYHEMVAQQTTTQAQRTAARQATADKRQAPTPRLAASPGNSEGNTGQAARPQRNAMRKLGRDPRQPLDVRIDAILSQI